MEVVDSEGVIIHNDIVQDNKYGPAIPGIDILSSLSNFTENCFLNAGLNRNDNYEQYQKINTGNDTCDISDRLTTYGFQQDIRTTDVPSSTVPKLRILLKELHELNNLSNKFFNKREEKAVEILEKGNTSDTGYSMRLNYMNRRKHTASSNSIALILTIIIFIFTIFTGGYLYFTGQIQDSMTFVIVLLPIIVWIVSILLGYIFIKQYALFLT